MKLEIERRFLLKGLPIWDELVEQSHIAQYYCESPEGPFRLRVETFSDRRIHTMTRKVAVSHGVNEEDESQIDAARFDELMLCHIKKLHKFRIRFPYQGLTWEVDDFFDPLKIVLAEIELPSIDYPIEIPEPIKNVMLMEVTGMKQFSNYNLAS